MKIVYHEDFLKQTQAASHPECPERLSSIMAHMDEHELHPGIITPEPADLKDITPVHSEDYLNLLKHFGRGRLDADTAVYPYTYDMAMLAAGGGIAAAANMLDHREPTFALVRPPGHHATTNQGMGFCYINNVAVAANWLRKKLDRVAIVDIDVHHGNGTNDAFLDRSDILYISTHQWGIYPGTGPTSETGVREGEGYTVNIPMGAHCGDATFEAARDRLIIPILEQFKPDALLVSLGVDAHYMDPLSSLTLSSKGYLKMMERMAKLAEDICENRWAVFLEGGYNIHALADVVGNAMAMAGGEQATTCFDDVADAELNGSKWISEAQNVHSKHWNL
ncbi:MAG: histone deacetylase [Thermoplasmata archaeon]